MEKDYLIDKIKKEGFENIADFIKANLHYLPENKQKLFISIQDMIEIPNNARGFYRRFLACSETVPYSPVKTNGFGTVSDMTKIYPYRENPKKAEYSGKDYYGKS